MVPSFVWPSRAIRVIYLDLILSTRARQVFMVKSLMVLSAVFLLWISQSLFAQNSGAAAPAASGQNTSSDTQVSRLAKLEQQVADAKNSADNAWMLTCAALVLLMTGPGLALFYGGLVRKKNVLATMMQSFAMMAIITVLWALVGYSLAFGPGNSFIGGLHNIFLRGVGPQPDADYAATIPQQTFMVYQLMFAIITPALITGAFAERMKFSAMLLFMALWTTFIYLPLAHMVWGNGGLLNAALGGRFPTLDFAGGTVVHISSGVSAFVCYLMTSSVKRRFGYDDSLDVFGIHGAGGTLGALLTGVFATRAVNPIFKDAPVGLVDGHAAQLLNQLVGIGLAIGFAIVGS